MDPIPFWGHVRAGQHINHTSNHQGPEVQNKSPPVTCQLNRLMIAANIKLLRIISGLAIGIIPTHQGRDATWIEG